MCDVFAVTGNENCVLTSSIDRSIKVWNLDYIFEKEQHIDKHELTIDSVSISTKAQIAVVVTRSCIGKHFASHLNSQCKLLIEGIWDFMTGKLKFKLANSALGAIITQALVNEEGTHGKYFPSPRQCKYLCSLSGSCGIWRAPLLGHPNQESHIQRQTGRHPANFLLQKPNPMRRCV